eukprot:TRINITY_DN80975_c0_g1_i1.p1 TRINITY_DN80975_c0_g1~~TRINITY_DN80975_c0_g1_i1.p1  ORF type:complete len:3310 (+),score=790.33 TRINITY_DN80975_c0_g1_i1:1463-9931(+)
MENFLQGYDLVHVFEHLIVCMRHQLVQSMYVNVPETDEPALPWTWMAQEKLRIHQEAMMWLPDVVKRFNTSKLLEVEFMRYVCAITTYYEAPNAPASLRGAGADEGLSSAESAALGSSSQAGSRPTSPSSRGGANDSAAAAAELEGDEELVEGTPVVVVNTFNSSGKHAQGLLEGLVGTVVTVKESGDLVVKFDGIEARQTIKQEKLENLAKHDPSSAAGPKHGIEELRPLARLVSADRESVHELVLEALQSDDPCTRALGVLSVSNTIEYERQRMVKMKKAMREMESHSDIDKTRKHLAVIVSGLVDYIPHVVQTMKEVHDWPREIGIPCMANGIRFFVTALAFGERPLTVEIMGGGTWEVVVLLFRQFFRDEHKVDDVKFFVGILEDIVTLLRNWICGGCQMEVRLAALRDEQMSTSARPFSPSANMSEAEKQRARAKLEKDQRQVAEALDTITVVNQLVAVVLKLTTSERKDISNLEEIKDNIYEDVLFSYQTIFKRQEDQELMDWKKLQGDKFDNLLEEIHKHRFGRTGVRDDETMVNTLYLITKLAYQFHRAHFPDYLMEVAYSPREEHCMLQDIAAICCAIIFTQSSKGGSGAPTCDLSKVVKDYKDFVRSMTMVPDPRMQLWHFRTLTQWCMRPKVLTDVTKDKPSLQFIVDALANEYMGRYAVVFIHNISCLRCHPLVEIPGHLTRLAEAYRRYRPGNEGGGLGGNAQRRMLRRLVLCSIRNTLYLVPHEELNTLLTDDDMAAIAHLVDVVETPDLPIFLASLLHMVTRCDHERVSRCFPQHGPLVEMCLRHLPEQSMNAMPGQQETVVDETDLYDYDPTQDEDDEEVSSPPGSPAGGEARNGTRPRSGSPTRIRGGQQPQQGRGDKRQPLGDVSRGLGKRTSIYRLARTKAASSAAGGSGGKKGEGGNVVMAAREGAAAAAIRKTAEREYIYYAVVEVLTHTTFKEDRPEICDAVDNGYEKFPLTKWLTICRDQVVLYNKDKLSLNDFYVHMTIKMIWHGWSNEIFRPHYETMQNMELLAQIIPFFLEWDNEDVNRLAYEVALYAKLHRYQEVCDYLVKAHERFPELSSILLSSALVDPETIIKPHQAVRYMQVFVNLLRSRLVTRGGLRRMVLGLETALLTEHPRGLAAYLLQQQYELLGNYLEQLNTYAEAAFVKQAMVVTLVVTVGMHYKAMPELDNFVLRVLDLAPVMLENEFTLFVPVLYRVCQFGGKRVQMPLLQRGVHLRLSRILENDVAELEANKRGGGLAAQKALGIVSAEKKPMDLSARQRVQWSLAVLAVLASIEWNQEELDESDTAHATEHEQEIHFDSFVCVDLLPILLRLLRTNPHTFEAATILFLISAVSSSPCLSPHMPDVLKLAERAFLPRIEYPDVDHDSNTKEKVARTTGTAVDLSADASDALTWDHIKLPATERVAIGMKRSFVHLLGNGGFLPANNPALLKSSVCFKYMRGLEQDAQLFNDPVAPVHVKVLCLAHMCGRKEDHQELLLAKTFEVLEELQEQITEEATKQPRDLRLIWLHATCSFAKLDGPKLLKNPKAVRLFEDSLRMAEEVMYDGRDMSQAGGLALALEAEQMLASVIAPMSKMLEFEAGLRAKYTMYLLCLIASGQLASLRLNACEFLVDMVGNGYQPEVCGAVLLSSPLPVESLRRSVGGPMDNLAASCARVMIAFVENGGYVTHVHLLQNLEAVVVMMGDVTSSAMRILWLAELFVAMTKYRTEEVIDCLIEQKGINAFLSLARSNMASRREIVQKWLEAYGSSLYEIDEVSEVFRISTLRGLLFMGARCSLDTEDAMNLRRIIFALIHRRVVTWRNSAFGTGQYLKEDLINAMVPMCELQPDLVAALVTQWHQLMTEGEHLILDRVWDGGHFPWLCRRMAHKSGAQMEAVRKSGMAVAQLGKSWERHADLVVAQSMTLRLLWQLYDMHPVELAERAVKRECVTKNWKELVTFYFHHDPWPMAADKEIEERTDAMIVLAMRWCERLILDLNADLLKKMVVQGMVGVCCAVLLPTPVVQKEHREDFRNPKEDSQEGVVDPEDALLPEAKMFAGSICARLMRLSATFEWIKDKRVSSISQSMFAQLHHWRIHLFVLQGSLSVISSVTLMERQAMLYMTLLWVQNIDWGFENLGIGQMATFAQLSLEIWARHGNPMLRHYALRMVSMWGQIHPVYCAMMAEESKAQMMEQAVHQTFGVWDVRALRHVLRILSASLAFALRLPVLPEAVVIETTRCCNKGDGKRLGKLMEEGGALRADSAAARHLLKPSFLSQVITWCEHPHGDHTKPGDNFGRLWALWLVMTILVHQQEVKKKDDKKYGGPPRAAEQEQEEPDELLVFAKEVNKAQLERRAKLLAEQAAVQGGGKGNGTETAEDMQAAIQALQRAQNEEKPPRCRTKWLVESTKLAQVLATTCGRCIRYQWKDSLILGNLATSRLLYELPHFLHNAVFTIDGPAIVKSVMSADKPLNLSAIMLISVLSCYRLPLKAQTVGEEFLQRFHDLQQEVLEGLAACGEGPYDLVARWMHAPPDSLPADMTFRCILAFLLGQCVQPPLAEAPSLTSTTGGSASPRTLGVDGKGGAPPVVAVCPPPPQALLDALAAMTLKEDLRLRRSQVKDDSGPPKGTLYSTMLCHLLYATAVIVPLHPKAASNSSSVRGAAFSQLMKVQQIVAQDIPSHFLYDNADGKRAKLFLYLRATACIRCALQCITGSWLAADFGPRFAISDEGGRDFIQYCAKHLNQAYNQKTAYTRVLGSPWERMMLDQGPTATIAELMLKVCSSDQNLAEISKLGGQQALHALSRFGETPTVRQQATMLLTKLAVMNA